MHLKRVHAKDKKNKEAKRRQQRRNGRTPAEQLVVLDERLGEGVGAESERERLQAMIDNPKPVRRKTVKRCKKK